MSAACVLPKRVVEKFRSAKILVTNVSQTTKPLLSPFLIAKLLNLNSTPSAHQIVGHPKRTPKALEAGEGGGHTGDMPASILIPAVVDEVRRKKSPLADGLALVMGASAVHDGQGLVVNLAWAFKWCGSAPGS